MWRQTPEQRVWLARQRQSELFREADQWNLIHKNNAVRIDGLPARLVAGYRKRAPGLVALLRRALVRDEAPCNDPCPDIA
jgi:hypothetical protein